MAETYTSSPSFRFSELTGRTIQKVDNMKAGLTKYLWVQAICLGFCFLPALLLPIPAFAQSADLAQNVEACKAGREVCDRSKLNSDQVADVALAAHGRNVENCRNGYDSCDRSKLSEPEKIALAVADHQRNVTDCNDGMQSCDYSKLTPSESRATAALEQQSNLTACKDGSGACDRSKLTPAGVEEVS